MSGLRVRGALPSPLVAEVCSFKRAGGWSCRIDSHIFSLWGDKQRPRRSWWTPSGILCEILPVRARSSPEHAARRLQGRSLAWTGSLSRHPSLGPPAPQPKEGVPSNRFGSFGSQLALQARCRKVTFLSPASDSPFLVGPGTGRGHAPCPPAPWDPSVCSAQCAHRSDDTCSSGLEPKGMC